MIVTLRVGPALWVMVRDLDHVPHCRGARRAEYLALAPISFYMALIQVSAVLTDKVDTTILGLVLARPRPQIAACDVVNYHWGLADSADFRDEQTRLPAAAFSAVLPPSLGASCEFHRRGCGPLRR